MGLFGKNPCDNEAGWMPQFLEVAKSQLRARELIHDWLDFIDGRDFDDPELGGEGSKGAELALTMAAVTKPTIMKVYAWGQKLSAQEQGAKSPRFSLCYYSALIQSASYTGLIKMRAVCLTEPYLLDKFDGYVTTLDEMSNMVKTSEYFSEYTERTNASAGWSMARRLKNFEANLYQEVQFQTVYSPWSDWLFGRGRPPS